MKSFTFKKIKELIERSLLEQPTGDAYLDGRYEEQRLPPIGHSQPYYYTFYWIAKELQPSFTVELGSWQATAACAFASGTPNGKVATIDVHDLGDNKALELSIDAANHYSNLEYINGRTWDVVDQIKDYNKPIDILFIDSWHERKYAEIDWALYSPMLADNALVICDDIFDSHLFLGMAGFWKDLGNSESPLSINKILENKAHLKSTEMSFIDMTNSWKNLADPPKTQNVTVEKMLENRIHPPDIPMGFMKFTRKKLTVRKVTNDKKETTRTVKKSYRKRTTRKP